MDDVIGAFLAATSNMASPIGGSCLGSALRGCPILPRLLAPVISRRHVHLKEGVQCAQIFLAPSESRLDRA